MSSASGNLYMPFIQINVHVLILGIHFLNSLVAYCWCFLSWALNFSLFSANFTVSGNLFQGSTILIANKFFLGSVLEYCTQSPCSPADCSVLDLCWPDVLWNNPDTPFSVRNLCTSAIFCAVLLSSSVLGPAPCSFPWRCFSLVCLQSWPLSLELSRVSLSPWSHGDHAWTANSRWGRIFCLYSFMKVCWSG
jgi:hypothetical protein